ncbi:GPI mannosyltransferase 2 [Gautieria morchelliformis]|nr:GPI mannosyltransferase 2 [Gautieria morchelliformis]
MKRYDHTTHEKVVKQHLSDLVLLCVLLRVLTVTIALLASYLPAFDSSADILLADESPSFPKRWVSTSLRWDAFHFIHIAQEGYQFDYEWAFLPGIPVVLRASGWIMNLFTGYVGRTRISSMLLGHFLISSVMSCETVRTLYLLTMEHTKSPAFSLLSGYLCLLSSSPATVHLAPYTEPWFSLLSYKGMLYCAQRRWIFASLSFSLACAFRSNGILLGGFLVWGMMVEPFIQYRRVNFRSVIVCMHLSVLLSLPFVIHQIYGYLTFCAPSTTTTSIKPVWCSRRFPLIYTYVQSTYWNVGFLRYWTIQQLPNFLIASPVLFLLSFSSITHVSRVIPHVVSPRLKSEPTTSPIVTFAVLPHAIHAFIFTCMLLFASHTQIILRLASSMPFTYWSAARLFFEHPKCAKAWVAWSVVWGAMNIVLWTVFLPPA